MREFSKPPKNKKDKNIKQPKKDKKVSAPKKTQKPRQNDNKSNQVEQKDK